MARGNGGFGSFPGDSNRDGIDDDIDRRPGNRAESEAYGRKYDPRSENEFTNLPEKAIQLRYQQEGEELREESEVLRDAMRDAQNYVHFFPSVGKFIIPEENTWAAHAELVKNKDSNLFFRPDKYVYFDKIIAEKFGNQALYDPNHRDYAKFEALRTNLAVMRNDIIGDYLEDGAFNPGDEKFIPLIEGIATEIGTALSHDKWYLRPFTRSFSVDVANVEGVGAREIYKFLLKQQTTPGPIPMFHHAFTFATHGTQHAWGLPPLEQTAYSDAGLSAPAPSTKIKLTQAQLLQRAASPELRAQVGESLQASGEQMAATAEGMLASARKLHAVETLAVPTKEESVEEARTILRWLRNLQFGDRDVETFLNQGTPAEQIAKTQQLGRLLDIYSNHVALAKANAPDRLNEIAVADATESAGAIAMGVGEHSLSLLPDFHNKIAPLEQLIDSLPAAAQLRADQPLSRLLDHMEAGIETAAGKTVGGMSATEKLLEMSKRISSNAYKLRSVDTLAPPAREESIELAREILRKLRNLGSGKQSAEEIVDTGRPEEKAALAQKIEEMVEMYGNLLSEAAQANPNIMNDPRIKEANDAVGGFAHAVKLMASKEIPNSIAAAQQISADITQMPEEWKNLHDRTVDRLITSMEGGLESAVADIEEQQQAAQQDEDVAQQVIDSSLHSHSRKRRRKRQGGSRLAPSSAKASKRRNSNDINGDGVLDKFQGLNLGKPTINLNATDLAAVRGLGDSLRNIGNAASTLTAATANVTPDEKIVPDDKNFVERKQEETQRNPRGNNRPRA